MAEKVATEIFTKEAGYRPSLIRFSYFGLKNSTGSVRGIPQKLVSLRPGPMGRGSWANWDRGRMTWSLVHPAVDVSPSWTYVHGSRSNWARSPSTGDHGDLITWRAFGQVPVILARSVSHGSFTVAFQEYFDRP